jgi:cytochrome P450
MTELDRAKLSDLPQWNETYHLPYLTAVIKEALRLHAPFALNLERVVPEGGATICGHFFPEGTIVGCNPAVIQKDTRVYGRRYTTGEYHPERWLEADEEEKADMERCFLAFGSGKRSCIGKNIGMLEIYKVVPLLLKTFNVSAYTSPTRLPIASPNHG